MSTQDVAVALTTIIYGLFLTDLFASLHKLIRHKHVKWHWLPVISAWFVFLIILKNWWGVAGGGSQWLDLLSFVAYSHLFVLIYLLVASVLPDDIPRDGINLKDYYFSNSRYFWSLMCLVIIGSNVVGMVISINHGTSVVNIILTSAPLLVMAVILAVSKIYGVHALLVSVLVLLVVLEILNKSNII